MRGPKVVRVCVCARVIYSVGSGPPSNTVVHLKSNLSMLHFNVKKKENMAAVRIELPSYSALTARGEKSDSASLFGASLVTVVHSHQQVMQ